MLFMQFHNERRTGRKMTAVSAARVPVERAASPSVCGTGIRERLGDGVDSG